MDSILHGSLLRIQPNKSFWLEVRSGYYVCLQNDAYIDYNEV